MPTRLPRLALTLPVSLRVTLDDLSEAMEKPLAALVVELLVEMEDQLKGLTKLVNASKVGNKAAVKRALVGMVGETVATIMSQTQPELFAEKRKRK